MSLATAALGWGVVSRRNNLYFELPYIGVIYIGINIAEFNQNISRCSKMALRVSHDTKNAHIIHYKTEYEEDILSVVVVSSTIHRIKYNNICSKIPQDIIYQVNKRMFLTNNRIDGHMIQIKGTDELILKQVDSIQAIDIDSKSLGIVKKALTRKEAENNSSAWANVFKTEQVYNTEIYKKSEAEVTKIETELRGLTQKEHRLEDRKRMLIQYIDRSETLNKCKDNIKEVDERYKNDKQTYDNMLNNYRDEIKRLISLGKLRNENGLIRLNKNSNNTRKVERTRKIPQYETVTSTYEPEMLLHEDYDQYERRRRRETSHSSEQVFSGYKYETYYEEVRDQDFFKAWDIADRLEKPGLRFAESSKLLRNAQEELHKAEIQISNFMNTSEYKNSLQELDSINAELDKIRPKINALKSMLYKK